jgi:hypothetical protein
MEDIECMDKFLKFNDTIFLFIKKIKNLEKAQVIVDIGNNKERNWLSNNNIDSHREKKKNISQVFV